MSLDLKEELAFFRVVTFIVVAIFNCNAFALIDNYNSHNIATER